MVIESSDSLARILDLDRRSCVDDALARDLIGREQPGPPQSWSDARKAAEKSCDNAAQRVELRKHLGQLAAYAKALKAVGGSAKYSGDELKALSEDVSDLAATARLLDEKQAKVAAVAGSLVADAAILAIRGYSVRELQKAVREANDAVKNSLAALKRMNAAARLRTEALRASMDTVVDGYALKISVPVSTPAASDTAPQREAVGALLELHGFAATHDERIADRLAAHAAIDGIVDDLAGAHQDLYDLAAGELTDAQRLERLKEALGKVLEALTKVVELKNALNEEN
ncbi:hypothetical protein OV203_21760 [Nannocystis sp. ILAH1]|uniref:hypothetical protein n=1 Tax=Nannocystis sp. ILAH1 TaxID=2996789 RepID=UPI00226DCFB9|nr:hypothetical protein [Nannocystis sp. ILAH1]MCY0989779.1 hypothetical protein [Nannocystis sp. ILAH1]